MSVRVQVLLEDEEHEAMRQDAERQGMSLSAWMRQAAREGLERRTETSRLDSTEALRNFFAECDELEAGTEPDWEEHRSVPDSSRGSGTTGT